MGAVVVARECIRKACPDEIIHPKAALRIALCSANTQHGRCTDYNGAAVRPPAMKLHNEGRPRLAAEPRWLAVCSLLTGSVVWGMIWFPYRALSDWGLGGIDATAATYSVAFLVALVAFRRELYVRPDWTLPCIALAAGLTNIGFVWSTIHGEVLRVVLLFYLMPVWTAVFARLILREKLTWLGAGVSIAALAGAALMLWNPSIGWPVPRDAAEWVGLAAGINFALSNVLLRRAARYSSQHRSLWILGGCVVVAGIGSVFDKTPMTVLTALPSTLLAWIAALIVLIGILLIIINLVVQYGIERLPANRVPVICLSELIVAGASSWVLAGEILGLKELAGGALIVAASIFSSRMTRH